MIVCSITYEASLSWKSRKKYYLILHMQFVYYNNIYIKD